MPETLSNWNELYKNRLEWAYKSRDNFINELGNENFKSLYKQNSSKKVNIAVYGKSQVGKTTLILKLIGIKEEDYEEVSDILRADIPRGRSVTPTSIIYSKSNDNYFHYNEGNSQYKLSGDELKEKLKNLRKRVEDNIEIDNLENSDSNVLIKIPLRFFDERNILDLNIIDLPGYGSANEKEQKHVQQVIDDIKPILNLVLIVSNRITDLENCAKPCRQFRYILTSPVSKTSVRKKFEEDKISNKENYVEFVRSEFEKLPKRVKVYPLEYGDSWLKLDKKIKSKAESIMVQLFADLRTDISESSTEYNQLMQNANYYIDIKKKIKIERKRFNKSVKSKKNELDKLSKFLKRLKILIDNSHEDLDDLINSICQNEHYNFDFNFSQFRGDNVTVKKLISYVLDFSDEICKKANMEWNNNEKYLREDKPKFSKISSNKSSNVLSKLDNHFLDRYFTDNSEKDKKECETVCLEMYRIIKNNIEFKIRGGIKSHNEFILNEIKEKKRKLERYNQKKDIIKTTIEIKKKELNNLENEKKIYKNQSSKDLNTAKKFNVYIENGFLMEKNRVIKIINSIETTKESKFFNILYLSLISSEFEKLIKQPI